MKCILFWLFWRLKTIPCSTTDQARQLFLFLHYVVHFVSALPLTDDKVTVVGFPKKGVRGVDIIFIHDYNGAPEILMDLANMLTQVHCNQVGALGCSWYQMQAEFGHCNIKFPSQCFSNIPDNQ